MKTKKKEVLLMLILFFGVLYGSGEDESRITGKFLLPAASGNIKEYDAVMVVKESGIRIECREKVFGLFNEFDTPRYRELEIKLGDFEEIVINERLKQVLITSSGKFHIRYRNLFFKFEKGIFECPVTYYCLGFHYTNPDEIGKAVRKRFSSLTRRSREIIWGSD